MSVTSRSLRRLYGYIPLAVAGAQSKLDEHGGGVGVGPAIADVAGASAWGGRSPKVDPRAFHP
jgi:hypothetical protein